MATESLLNDDDVTEVTKGKVKKGLQWILLTVIIVFLFGMIYLSKSNKSAEKQQQAALTEKNANAKKPEDTPDVATMTKSQIKTPEPTVSKEPPNKVVEQLREGSDQFRNASAGVEKSSSESPAERRRAAETNVGATAFHVATATVVSSAERTLPNVPSSDPRIDAAIANANKQMADIDKLANAPLDSETPAPVLPKTNAQLNSEWLQGQSRMAGDRSPEIIADVVGEHVIFEGTLIPAIVTEGVSTDMPGKFSAKTRSNVYDRKRTLIIPAGSTVLGAINTSVNPGQELVQAAFYRIILPNGKSIWLSGMEGADEMGRNGVPGDVDNHFLRMFGTSFAIAAIQGIFVNNDSSTNVNNPTGSVTVISSAAGQSLSDVSREILQRNRSISPTITLRPGQSFNIRIVKDILGEPYRIAP